MNPEMFQDCCLHSRTSCTHPQRAAPSSLACSSSSSSSVKDELVLLQGAAHLHLVTSALAEEACDALSRKLRVSLQERLFGWTLETEATHLQEVSWLRDASILTDVDQDPPDFIHEAGYLRSLRN